MNEEKLALLKKMYKERKLTLNEMALELGVSFPRLNVCAKLGLTDRYIKIKTANRTNAGRNSRTRSGSKGEAPAYKKENGRPEFRPSDRPGYKFCGKTWRFNTFET